MFYLNMVLSNDFNMKLHLTNYSNNIHILRICFHIFLGEHFHSSVLLHTMAYLYVIYSYVISEWRSIRPVEINQYDFTMATHYDITMGNDITRDMHCQITIGNDVARDIHCDVTMSNDVAMCTYHGITMHNDVAMNLFYCVFSVLCLIMILLCVVCNKKQEQVHV